MSNSHKPVSARTAALAVLAKVHEVLAKSDLIKYETENSPKPGIKYGSIETKQKPIERDYNEYEVKSGNSKDSAGPRVAKQISPSKNPKEEAEGNNKSDGMEPRYEFKDKVKKEIAKQDMDKSEKILAKKYEGFEKVKREAAESGASDPAAVAAAAGRKKYGKEAFQAAAAKGKKMHKASNPDKEADAQLGEKVEKDVEEHFKENKEAEAKEGHELMAKSDKKKEKLKKGESKHDRCVKHVEENSPDVKNPHAVCVAEGVKPEKWSKQETDKAVIPRLILSAKLSKFMEHLHSKRAHAKAQSPEAVGSPAEDAPTPGSTEDGRE